MASKHEIVGQEWKARAPELALWAMDNLVNRKDVWGQYSVLTPSEQRESEKTYKAMTLPIKSKRGKDMVTLDKLTRHFASRRNVKPQLIGLHAKSKTGTSRWLGIDIDCHDSDSSLAEDHARRNLAGALSWWRALQAMGYDPLLFDSSNRGGYHLWILFAEPAPTMDIFAFGQQLIANWQELGLDEEPETFPKLPKEGSLGSWFRLPGLHHTRDHYSTVWSGDEWLSDPWMSGHAAIDIMLQTIAGPAPPAAEPIFQHSRTTRFSPKLSPNEHRSRAAADHPVNTATASTNSIEPTAPMGISGQPGGGEISGKITSKSSAPARNSRFKRTGKATVCVDLDGVLAKRREGRMDIHMIGEPVDGAREFLHELSEQAYIVIYTARFGRFVKQSKNGAKMQREISDLTATISEWMESNHLKFDEIWSQTGKPIASAYVDDRAVSCRPEELGLDAFAQAQISIRKLCET